MSDKASGAAGSELTPPKLQRSESVLAFSEWLASPLCDRDLYFRSVADGIVYSRAVMADSVTQQLMAKWEGMISESPLTATFDEICIKLCKVAAGDELKDASDDKVKSWRIDLYPLGSGCAFSAMARTRAALREWYHPLLAAALQQCAETDISNCQVTCAMICKTASNCDAAKRFMFTLLVKRAVSSLPEGGHLKPQVTAAPAAAAAAMADPSSAAPAASDGDKGDSAASGAGAGDAATAAASGASSTGMDPAVAREILRSFCMERVDELKEKALASTFYEPALWYLETTGGSTCNFEVHAANVYLSFLAVVLGVRTSRQPYIDDPNCTLGLVHWRHSAPVTAIEAFQRPEYLGKGWMAISKLKGLGVERAGDPRRAKLVAKIEEATAKKATEVEGAGAMVQQAEDKLKAYERKAACSRWALEDGEVEAWLAGKEPYDVVHAAARADASGGSDESGAAAASAATGGAAAAEEAKKPKSGDEDKPAPVATEEPGPTSKPPSSRFLQKGSTPRETVRLLADGTAPAWQMRAARGYAAHFASYFAPHAALQRLVVACNQDGGPKSALIRVFEAMRDEQNALHKEASTGDGASASADAPEGRPCLWPPLEESLSVDFFFFDDEDYEFLTHNAVRFFHYLGMVRESHVAKAARDAWAAFDAAEAGSPSD